MNTWALFASTTVRPRDPWILYDAGLASAVVNADADALGYLDRAVNNSFVTGQYMTRNEARNRLTAYSSRGIRAAVFGVIPKPVRNCPLKFCRLHNNPPSHRIREIFQIGQCRDNYVKPRDAARILRENDLKLAIADCPEVKALVNTILRASGGEVIR